MPAKADLFYAVNAHATFETFTAEIAGLFSIDGNHDESSAQLHVETIGVDWSGLYDQHVCCVFTGAAVSAADPDLHVFVTLQFAAPLSDVQDPIVSVRFTDTLSGGVAFSMDQSGFAQPIPEPSSAAIVIASIGLLAAIRRKRIKSEMLS